MTLKVSDIGEKELVKYIIANSKKITPDDTAVTPFLDLNLISTCDMLIQSRHFPKNMSYFDMGFKAVTVNVSDLAAMGAEPLGFLLSIAIPKDLEVDSFKQIIDGVFKACDYYSIPLIGGDTNEAYPDSQWRHSEGQRRQGRLRRVPDLLPVRLQDFLHRCQPEVREPVIYISA